MDIEAIRFLNAREDEGISVSALLALYPGVDVEGAARRESSNGLAMMTSLKGVQNDDRREE